MNFIENLKSLEEFESSFEFKKKISLAHKDLRNISNKPTAFCGHSHFNYCIINSSFQRQQL
jgi:ethanolamine utilization cobalamin adenosyltransferase